MRVKEGLSRSVFLHFAISSSFTLRVLECAYRAFQRAHEKNGMFLFSYQPKDTSIEFHSKEARKRRPSFWSGVQGIIFFDFYFFKSPRPSWFYFFSFLFSMFHFIRSIILHHFIFQLHCFRKIRTMSNIMTKCRP